MEASVKFYDPLFKETGLNQVLAGERMTFWQGEDITFAVAKPFDGEEASNGNGTMVGFSVSSIEEVKNFIKGLLIWVAPMRVIQISEVLGFLHMFETWIKGGR